MCRSAAAGCCRGALAGNRAYDRWHPPRGWDGRDVRREASISVLTAPPHPSRRTVLRGLLALVVAAVAVVGQRVPLAAQSVSLGEENSWLRIQNVGGRAATVDVTLYDTAGSRVAVAGCPSGGVCPAIAPGVGWSFFQQGLEAVQVGYRGAALVKSDQPFVALLARDAFKGGRFQIGGDTLRLGRGTAGMAFPIVQNTDQWMSRISVQNTSDRPACVELRYWTQGQATPVAIDPPSRAADCPQGGAPVAPHASLVRDERNFVAPFGFDGAATVRTYDTASGIRAGDQTLTSTIETRERAGPGLASSRGIAPDEQNRVVALPLVERNSTVSGTTWNTRFRIVNANPAASNEVTLRYDGVTASGDRVEIEHKMSVTGVLTCDQRDRGCLPADRDLPDTFTGSVRLQSIEPIAVYVQRASAAGGLADYRGFTVSEASRQVVLPILDKSFGPFGESTGWNSWFRVVSFDGSPSYVRVIYYSRQNPTGQLRDPINAANGVTVLQNADRNLPEGWVGSAIVISDQPVIVLVGIESAVFKGDSAMLYNGVGFD